MAGTDLNAFMFHSIAFKANLLFTNLASYAHEKNIGEDTEEGYQIYP